MKLLRISSMVALSVFWAGPIYGQDVQTPATTNVPAGTQNVPAPTAFHVISEDGNSRVWQREIYLMTPDGHVVTQKHSYTELRAGVNYWSNGAWVPSQEEITVQPDGSAAATQGQHQVHFPADIYQGLIQMTTPEGLTLQSQPAALAYDDGEHTVILGVLTNSVGQLVGKNQVIYTNAFSGVNADILYTYRLSGAEQDIVLRSQLPSPESLGLNAATTKLQVLTEFINPATPEEVTQTDPSEGNEPDSTLKFGATTFGHGRAFMLGNETGSRTKPIKVYKSWLNLQGRTFLIEAVPYHLITAQLQALPSSSSVAKPDSGRLYALRAPSGHYDLPARVAMVNVGSKARFSLYPRRINAELQTALNPGRVNPMIGSTELQTSLRPGLVLDYVTINAAKTNFTFQGDTTYYVGGSYSLYGTTTIEGGTVIKMNGSGELNIDIAGSVHCETGPYHPGIFTSANDNSVGETLGFSSGNPMVNDVGIFLCLGNPDAVLSNLRMNYAFAGFEAYGNLDVWNCQFTPTDMVVAEANNVGLHNVLVRGVFNSDTAVEYTWGQTYAENVTLDGGDGLGVGAETNCIEVYEGIGDGTDFLPGGSVPVYTNGVYAATPAISIFHGAGAGYYYLGTNSLYQGTGTTNVSPELLADLADKTTYAPTVISNLTISVAITNSPTVPRDDQGALDFGYHYDPLDYIYGHVTVATNLVLTAGTAVGWYDHSGWGLGANPGVLIQFAGTATQPCVFAHYATVQEESVPAWKGASPTWFGVASIGSETDPAQAAVVSSVFTHAYSLVDAHQIIGDDGSVLRIWAKNSEFYSGALGGYGDNYFLTNCLIDRVYVSAQAECCAQIDWLNCTLHGCTLAITHWGSWPVAITNCAFDGTDFSAADATDMGWNYNAYTNSASPPMTGAHDVTVTNFVWETSWFGRYYLPTNSLLIDKGNTTANLVGLYHFTTQTNQTVEGDSTVDIGYHYVATDQDGNPLDSNGDGIPDYLEDTNGDGLSGGWLAPVYSSGTTTFPNGFTIQIFEPKPRSQVP